MSISSLVTGFRAAEDWNLKKSPRGDCWHCNGKGLIRSHINPMRGKPFHHPRSGHFTICQDCNGTGNKKKATGT